MIFLAATLLRGRWGPSLTGGVFAICALMGPVNQVAIMTIFAADTFGIYQMGAQLPHWVPSLVAAISFWAYMHEARRPNLYYRRRVRIGPAEVGRWAVFLLGHRDDCAGHVGDVQRQLTGRHRSRMRLPIQLVAGEPLEKSAGGLGFVFKLREK